MRRNGMIGLGVLLALSLPAFPVSLMAQDKFVVGFTTTLSGDNAVTGQSQQKGLLLAQEEINKAGGINGAPIEIKVADDHFEIKEGPLIAQRFCSDDSVKVVMGYSFSSIALAAVPIFDRCKLPVLASGTSSPKLSGSSKFFRRNVMNDAIQGALFGRYVVEVLGKKRIALIHQQDDYGVGLTDAFEKAAKDAGAEIVIREKYVLGTKDFHTQLTNIKATNPDAMFIGGFYAEIAKIAQQAKEVGAQFQLTTADSCTIPDVWSLGGASLNGTYCYAPFDPTKDESEKAKAFVAAFNAKFGEPPDAWAALVYDAMYTVAEAARIAGKNDRQAINEAFSRIKDFPGVSGPTTFDEKGDRVHKLFFYIMQDGKLTLAPKQMTF
jgi:branched-chain amino acid transport system substrate-binding protein